MSKSYNEVVNSMKAIVGEVSKLGVDSPNFREFRRGTADLFSMARMKLATDESTRFFGNFIMQGNPGPSYAIKRPIHHQVTNTSINILYNPILMIDYNIDEICNLLCKEVCHLVAKHYLLQVELKDKHPWVVTKLACELEASAIMEKSGIKLMSELWTTNKINMMFDAQLTNKPAAELAKELHELMYTNEDFANFVIDSMDPALFMEGNEDPLLIGDMIKYVVIENCSTDRGTFPAGLAGLIEEMTAPPVVTWQQELSRFIGSVASGRKDTIFRRNRRQPDRVDLKGQLPDKELDIVVALDTSGSMSDEIISKCMNEILHLTKHINTTITMLECDTSISKTYEIKDAGDIQYEISGRGGTSFKEPFEYMEENGKHDSILIYLTDGYGEYSLGDTPNVQQGTIWILTDKKQDLSLKGEHLPARSLVLSLTNK